MSSQLNLSSTQVDAIFRAAKPLRPEDVGPFLQIVVDQLRASPVIGDGVVYRAVELAQRTVFDPPELDTAHGLGKYARR
jgi:hypothetical protein